EPYRKRLSEEMSRVLCINATPLSRPTPGVESPLANFFADAMLHAAQKEDPETVLAFGTNGALRSSLPAGEITVGHLYELMPFDNQMVILELSGEQVLKLASFIVSSKGQAVAGMRLTQNNSRLTRVEIGGQL